MSLESQMLVNKLLIPKEILSIIKDYSFSTVCIENIKLIKKEINKKFKFAISRTNNFNYNKSINLSERWCFWFGDDKDIQYQASNCAKCGNYKLSYNILEINSLSIVCQCSS